MNRTFFRRIGIFLAAALLLAPAALAQGNQQQTPQPPSNVDVSDAELETIAGVVLQIQSIQQSYAPKMKQAENQQQAMKMRKEFQQKITQTIQQTEDISPQRFSTIMRAAQADSTLGQRIGQAVQSARQDSMSGNGGGR